MLHSPRHEYLSIYPSLPPARINRSSLQTCPFAISEPPNPPIDVLGTHNVTSIDGFYIRIKLWKGRSGSTLLTTMPMQCSKQVLLRIHESVWPNQTFHRFKAIKTVRWSLRRTQSSSFCDYFLTGKCFTGVHIFNSYTDIDWYQGIFVN